MTLREWHQVLESFNEDERLLRLFACDRAEEVLHIYEDANPDDDSPRKMIEVSRRFANGDATQEELLAARDRAWVPAGVWDNPQATWAARAAVRTAAPLAQDAVNAMFAARAALGTTRFVKFVTTVEGLPQP